MADAFLDAVAELAQSTAELHRRAAAMLRELAAIAREAGAERDEAVLRLLLELDVNALRHLAVACDCHDPTPPPGALPSTGRSARDAL